MAGALPGLPRGRRPPGTGVPGNPGAKFDGENRPSAGRLASRLVTGIRLRNFLTVVNNYYDDMAWLALATLRLDKLAEDTRKHTGRERNAKVLQSLTLQFDSASTDDLGGGTFWSTKRDFKNTPATAPVALYYARTGNRTKAQALLDWLDARLYEPGQGLYRDGLRISGTARRCWKSTIYTYNQGPVLGALLELGGEANLGRAAALVDAVARQPHRTGPAAGPQRRGAALRGNGRRRALHRDPRPLPGPGRRRRTAARRDPGHGGGAGERYRRGPLGGPPDPPAAGPPRAPAAAIWSSPTAPTRRHAAATRQGAAVELSTQLQAWMVLEAAASIAHGAAPHNPAELSHAIVS